MSKKALAFFGCVALCLLLCGCSTFVPLSERAIVKAIYLDTADGAVQAALAVYTCTPSANTAEVQGMPRIYTGEGATVEQAITAAEKQQNKKPFYAQNRLLLLGPHAFERVSELLTYFGAEEVSRASLSVFLTHATREEFTALEENVTLAINEGERLTRDNAATGKKACGIHEVRFDEKGRFYGYLPILQMNAEGFMGVAELMLYDSGTAMYALQGVPMQLTLLLSEKASRLDVTLPLAKAETTLRTQHLFLQREVGRDGVLTIILRGKVEGITQNGRALQGDAAQQALTECNAQLQATAQQLMRLTLQQGNDVFSCGWWVENNQGRRCNGVVVRSNLVQS